MWTLSIRSTLSTLIVGVLSALSTVIIAENSNVLSGFPDEVINSIIQSFQFRKSVAMWRIRKFWRYIYIIVLIQSPPVS